MAVNKVEYVRNSSTPGFAVAGDEKTITKSTANTIQKDVDQGNTEKLDQGQQKYLDSQVDYDSLDYTDEEMNQVGRNQINDRNTQNTNGLQTTGAMLGGGAGAAAGVLAPALGAPIGGNAVNITTTFSGDLESGLQVNQKASLGNGANFSDIKEMPKPESGGSAQGGGTAGDAAKNSGIQTEKSSKIPWAAVASGAIALAGGALAMVGVNKFDDQLKERTAHKNESEQTNQIIQQYYDDLGTDMDSMAEESGRYQELVSAQTQADVDTVTQIGALQSEMMVYQSQGNTQKVAELKAQIDNIKKGAEEDGGNREEITNIKGNLEVYAGRSAEAQGVKESGDNVSEFLRDGKQMGILATVQTALITVGAVLMLKGTLNAVQAAMKVPFLLKGAAMVLAMAGAAMMVAGNLLTLGAALKMGQKAKEEFDCADAGETMRDNLGQLGENIEAQASYTEASTAGYLELDTKAAETVGKTQQGVDKANQAQAQRQQGTPSTPPPSDPNPNVGGGTGEGEPEGEDELVA